MNGSALELPDWRRQAGDHERALHRIDAWSDSDALGSVVAAFGETLPRFAPGRSSGTDAGKDPGHHAASGASERLDFLVDFSARHLDFRAGRERNLAPRAVIGDRARRAIDAAAPVLGLAGGTAPRRDHYTYVVMTGGMVRACVVKPRFVAAAIADGLRVDEVVFLGGFRPFAGDEVHLAAALHIDADNEFDAMVAGVRASFGTARGSTSVSSRGKRTAASEADVSWTGATGQKVRVVAAPSSQPALRRADTRDTYRHWAGTQPTHGASALLVTTPVYVPYQATLAVEELGIGAGMAVETTATDAKANDLGPHSQVFGAQERLQELRAAITGMRSLRSRLSR